MKNGIYYTDGSFLLVVSDEDAAIDGRDCATHIEAWQKDELLWRADKDAHTHETLVKMNAELTQTALAK